MLPRSRETAGPATLAGTIRWLHLLAALVALALLALVFRSAEHVYDMPLTEDGYYALSVARNLAQGNGITIDGTVLTNGFQPLFTMIEAMAFLLAGGDETLAMRLVLGFAWLFHLAGAATVGLIARDAWPARGGEAERACRLALGAFLYLAAPLMFGHAYNGLETGATLFFYAVCWRLVQRGRDRSLAGLAGLGALLGLTVLARIDAGFLAVALALREAWHSRHQGPATVVLRLAAMAGVAVVVSAPWWLYNLVYFGSPLPTSGLAQQAFALDALRFEFAGWALRLVLVPWIFLGAEENLATGIARGMILLGAAWLALRAWRRGAFGTALAAAPAEEALAARRTLEFALCLAAAMAALVAYYMLGFVAYWFYYRYFAPAALFAFVAAPVAAARFAIGAGARPHWQWAQRGLALVLAAQIVVIAGLAQSGRGLGGNTVYHDQVALVREHVPAGELVAGGQTGTLGFFRDRVINLDGKVNRDALEHQDRMWDYLAARGIRWFVDWPHYVEKYLGSPPEANGWRLVAERNYFYLYERSEPGKP